MGEHAACGGQGAGQKEQENPSLGAGTAAMLALKGGSRASPWRETGRSALRAQGTLRK